MVDDVNTDHAAAYLNAQSATDPATNDNDWVQIGFYVGNGDGNVANTTKVYAETKGPNGGADTYKYSYDWGNRYFTDEFVYQYDSSGRGLYYGWYSLNYQVLGHAWLINPGDTQQHASIEGHKSLDSGYCPSINGIQIGTTGSADSWNSSTEVKIYNDTSQYVSFTPNNVASTNITTSPYYLDVWNVSDAFYAYGG